PIFVEIIQQRCVLFSGSFYTSSFDEQDQFSLPRFQILFSHDTNAARMIARFWHGEPFDGVRTSRILPAFVGDCFSLQTRQARCSASLICSYRFRKALPEIALPIRYSPTPLPPCEWRSPNPQHWFWLCLPLGTDVARQEYPH